SAAIGLAAGGGRQECGYDNAAGLDRTRTKAVIDFEPMRGSTAEPGCHQTIIHVPSSRDRDIARTAYLTRKTCSDDRNVAGRTGDAGPGGIDKMARAGLS